MLLLGSNLNPVTIVSIIIVLFFGMGLHEFAHAITADYWGDPTPRQNGKITLNPLAHINWQGWLMIFLIGFGIAGSVSISPSRMRDPRWGMFWTALAGPFSNLLQAIVFGLLYRLFGAMLPSAVVTFLWIGVIYNCFLFFLNMLPLFPLDGYTALLSILPGYWLSGKQVPAFIRKNVAPISRFAQQPAYTWQSWRDTTMIILGVMILSSFAAASVGIWWLNLFGMVIGGPSYQLAGLLAGLPF